MPETGRLRVVTPTDRREEQPANTEVSVEHVPSPGRYIREQRLRKGLSLDQLAAATKIPRSSLELLEEDRFEELPGPVFAKGFLRCCARALDIGPDVVMELLYDRERAALVARRRESAARVSELEVEATNVRADRANQQPLQKLLERLPTPQQLLWVVVAALVAMVLMAAFNLVGGSPGGPTS